VPVFAGLVALATRPSRRNYPQHLYFALHVHAAWFFAAALAAAAHIVVIPYRTPIVSGAAVLYGAVYFVLAFRRAYDAPPLKAIVRTAAVGVTYAMVVLATLLAIAVPVIFRR